MLSLDIVTIVEAHRFADLAVVTRPGFPLPDYVFSNLAEAGSFKLFDHVNQSVSSANEVGLLILDAIGPFFTME